MWALASLLSTQFRDMIEPLYQKTKPMLEHLSLEADEKINLTTELAQAWVLVVIFESMRTYHQQAWMSVSRAFRLCDIMKLTALMIEKGPPLRWATLLRLKRNAGYSGCPTSLIMLSAYVTTGQSR